MEAAICTRCQSANPLFTKFCLICGLEITEEMKRITHASAPQRSAMLQNQDAPEPAVATSSRPAEPTPQKEGSRWLKSLRLLGRS